jgi:hypothetical protein
MRWLIFCVLMWIQLVQSFSLLHMSSIMTPKWNNTKCSDGSISNTEEKTEQLILYHQHLRNIWQNQERSFLTVWDNDLHSGVCTHFSMMMMREAARLGFCHRRFVYVNVSGEQHSHMYTEVLLSKIFLPATCPTCRTGRTDSQYPDHVWITFDNNYPAGFRPYEQWGTDDDLNRVLLISFFDFSKVETFTILQDRWIPLRVCNVSHVISRVNRKDLSVPDYIHTLLGDIEESFFSIFTTVWHVLNFSARKSYPNIDDLFSHIPKLYHYHICDVISKFD